MTQQQQQPVSLAPPTLEEIESKHSQLPPQYRQAVLEQQQREHQQRLLQQQQQQQQQQSAKVSSPNLDSPRLPSSSSLASPSSSHVGQGNRTNPSHQRILSAPHTNSHRSNRGSDATLSTQGPSRAHWKTIPLDNALDFNPAMGISSRACIGCFEEFEQWQGVVPTSLTSPSSTYNSPQQQLTHHSRGAIGSVSESNLANNYGSGAGVGTSSHKPNGHITDGLFSQTGSSTSGDTLGREDIVRGLPKSTSDNIAIKSRPAQGREYEVKRNINGIYGTSKWDSKKLSAFHFYVL
ncbi:hypothetical protein BGZ94_005046 [Podila epigama]|nr:hypothetical protein BGZ94_005046 [Podila epigama]